MERKKLYLLCGILLLINLFSYAQAPESISYQAVVRDSGNKLSVNQNIGVRITILLNNESVIYTETHSVTTNSSGLMNLQIGQGTIVSGVFSSINWASGVYFVKTEIDPSGGKNYSISSTTQLLSVPYALHAKTAQKLSSPLSFNDLTDVPASEKFSGDYGDLTNKPVLFDGKYSSLTDKPELFSGNYNDLTNKPALFDGKYSSLTDKPVIFSGSYKDLTNKPSFNDSIQKYGFSGRYSDLIDPPTATFTGKYGDLLNKPVFKDSIQKYGFSGNYNDLKNRPDIFSGIYSDLLYKPVFKDSIQKYGFSGDYFALTNRPNIKDSVLIFSTNTNYNNLINKPDIKDSIRVYGFDGVYDNLSNKPNFRDSIAKYKFSGNYNDLTNVPVVNVKDTVEKYNFSGEYDDLKGKPKGVNEGDILYWKDNRWSVLPLGLDGQILTSVNSQLTWKDASLFIGGNTDTYEVGDVYYQGGVPEGIIIEVSQVGQYGKLLSLTEYRVVWDERAVSGSATPATETFSRNQINGEVNMNNIRNLTDGIEFYPAFEVSATHGAGWYLPALKEMELIASKKADLEAKLQAVSGAQQLGGKFYWTSTEDRQSYANAVVLNDILITLSSSSDPEDALDLYMTMPVELDFSAYLDEDGDLIEGATLPIDTTLTTGNLIKINKAEVLAVRPIRRMSWSEVSSKPKSDVLYNLGDVYYDIDGTTALGIVCEVWNGGLNGKILSLDQDSLQWSSEKVLAGTTSRSDGMLNRSTLVASSSVTIENYEASLFCMEKGTKWYMPAIGELQNIYTNMDVLNTALAGVTGADLLVKATAPTGDPLPAEDKVYYWSSTETDADDIEALNFGSSAMSADNVEKTEKAFVRAVRVF